jgi:hypothetical protein
MRICYFSIIAVAILLVSQMLAVGRTGTQTLEGIFSSGLLSILGTASQVLAVGTCSSFLHRERLRSS